MKRLIVILLGAAAVAGCAVFAPEKSRCPEKVNPVKVGVYGAGAKRAPKGAILCADAEEVVSVLKGLR